MIAEVERRDASLDWLGANQRVLAAELRRIAALVASGPGKPEVDDELAAAERAIQAARETLDGAAAVDHVTNTFGLSPFERDLLLLCAGVELDASIARRCAQATGGPWATSAFALAVLPDGHWSALLPGAPLRRYRLIGLHEDRWRAAEPLLAPEVVVHRLAGIELVDPSLAPMLEIVDAAPVMVTSQRNAAQRAILSLRAGERPPVVQLIGDDLDGQRDVAAYAAAEIGTTLYAIHAEDIPTGLQERLEVAATWSRDSALAAASLLIDAWTVPSPRAITEFVDSASSVVFIASREPVELRAPSVRIRVEKPLRPEQVELWDAVTDSLSRERALLAMSAGPRQNLSVRSIVRAAGALRVAPPGRQGTADAIRDLTRPASDSPAHSLWERVEVAAAWSDLVLPDEQLDALHQIAAQVRLSPTVYERWGFATADGRGLGITALFAGDSGTGKTLAAEVLANELSVELYRIDLSAVVSKYIGETEKSLRHVFDAAEDSGAILLFDESDALFGKRSEVKDSHDRYANIEVSYLLQRMEAYRGLAILTTNMKSGLDRAFLRRLRFMVQFPVPDAALRERIWRNVFPSTAPRRAVDYRKLAQLNITGGSIRNIALNAAFLAADDGAPVTMRHLLRAATAEAGKRERVLTDADAKGWVAQ